jgi:hypothetical protein
MTHCEDLFFWIKISAEKIIMYSSVDDYIYNVRAHNNSATRDEFAWKNGYIKLIKKIKKLKSLSYRDTMSMRFKISLMLMKWHVKRKILKDIIQIFKILI